MGKKPKALSKVHRREDDNDDESSIHSASTVSRSRHGADDDVDEQPSPVTAAEASLSEHLDNLSQKRTQVREQALLAIINELRQYRLEWISDNKLTLTLYLRRCVVKGGKEALLALEAFGLVVVTLAEPDPTLLEEWEGLLSKSVQHGREVEVQRMSATLLAAMCFIMDDDGAPSKRCLDLMEQIFVGDVLVASSVIEAALHAWAFLLTKFSARKVATDYYHRCAVSLAGLLSHADVDIRAAAGENLALLADMTQNLPDEQRPPRLGEFLDDLHQQIETLMSECSKRFSKKDKKQQRLAFRSISQTIERGESPEDALVIDGTAVHFTSWAKLCQVEVFREMIGAGIQAHFQENVYLQRLFGYQGSASSKATPTDKKQFLTASSAAEKNRSADRRTKRQHKMDRAAVSDEDSC